MEHMEHKGDLSTLATYVTLPSFLIIPPLPFSSFYPHLIHSHQLHHIVHPCNAPLLNRLLLIRFILRNLHYLLGFVFIKITTLAMSNFIVGAGGVDDKWGKRTE